jgi:DNA-binding beta-propeller fold protein YncE
MTNFHAGNREQGYSALSWRRYALFALAAVCALWLSTVFAASAGEEDPAGTVAGVSTATGKRITPTAARGAIYEELDPHLPSAPDRRPGGAAAVALSPDGKRLAIMTSGFHAYFDGNGDLVPEASTEYVFIYDISGAKPRQTQVLFVPDTFPGMTWGANGHLYVSGGKTDDVIEFSDAGGKLEKSRTFALGHEHCLTGKPTSGCGPVAGDVAVSPDGNRLLVTNIQNDSVSLIDLSAGKVVAEQDLRPGMINPEQHGVPGGTFPRSVVWTSPHRAYVGSVRDRELIALEISGQSIQVHGRAPLQGQPSALITNQHRSRLYVALDTTSQIAVYDPANDSLIEKFNAVAPPTVYDDSKLLGGANTNAMALTPDGRTMLVSNGGLNSIAVVRLSDRAIGEMSGPSASHEARHRQRDDDEQSVKHSVVVGLVPTGWYPTGVATGRDGGAWYIVNAKSPMGPNSGWCHTTNSEVCDPKIIEQPFRNEPDRIYAHNGIRYMLAKNVHVNQLERSGFLTMRAPAPLELARLTRQVARNNRFDRPEKSAADERVFSLLRQHIKHVIYIMKENRTYDQVLGDLEVGNGDPRLTMFPDKLSPNHHSIARNFVTLDNILVAGEGSINGAYWTFAGQTNDFLEHEDTLTLSTGYKKEQGGFPYGTNRSDNIAYATGSERHAADKDYPNEPDILPGTRNVFDVDGPGGEAGAGYIWNAAVRGGLTIRDYGIFTRLFNVTVPEKDVAKNRIGADNPGQILAAYSTADWPSSHDPDFPRVLQWKRDFAEFVARKEAPSLTTMMLGGDHFGNFSKALYGVNTPETQMADNDYAVGTVVDTVANSPFANDTLVIVIEDDASDGPDHVDAERTVALFAGAYVRQHAVVSTRYTTVNVVKTIEAVLGIGPISLNDALAEPMTDVFDPASSGWTYKAIVPDVLRSTQVPLPRDENAHIAYPSHSAAYWAKAMKGQDFSAPDRIETTSFNHALWRGLKGDEPYPKAPTDDAKE